MAKEIENLKEKIRDLEQELTLKNAELMRYRLELNKANQVLENMIAQTGQELKLAQTLQRHLSPTELPNISGFEFSTKFIAGTRSGGDYFDIFEHEDKLKFGILLACSSGYTMSALLLSVVIRISSQIEARRGMEPSKVMALLAKEIVPSIHNKDKASVFYGIIDRRTFELQYSSVGSIDGFLQIYGEETLMDLRTPTPALAKDFNTEPQTFRLQLNPRDRLILATEGLRGSENKEGQMWGQDSLRAAIQRSPKKGAHELRNEILYSNEKFTGSQEPVRDQTLLITEVKDRVIKLASR